MEQNDKKSVHGLNRGNLKMIALFCMTIDHFAVAIFESWLLKLNNESAAYAGVLMADLFFRLIGRLAFPIFCFFIAEGLKYTKNIYKYAFRLLLLGIISEVPFDMVLMHEYFTFEYQNVFWTLLIGLLTIYCIDGIFERLKISEVSKTVIASLISLDAFVLAESFKTDYGCLGVLTIVIIYLTDKNMLLAGVIINIIGQAVKLIFTGRFDLISIIVSTISIIIMCVVIYLSKKQSNINSRKMLNACCVLCCQNLFEISAIANIWIMRLYNGQKGKKIGWLFYVFYPLHLAILALLCMLVGLY